MFHFFYSIYNLFAQFFDMKAVDMWNLVIYVVVTSGGAVLNCVCQCFTFPFLCSMLLV